MEAKAGFRPVRAWCLAGTAAAAVCLGLPTGAQQVPSYNTYGVPGLIDMPSAEMAPDATISLTYGRIDESNRGAITFQLTPRLSGTFRYAGIGNFDDPNSNADGVFYDRSFDLRFQLLTETSIRPAVAIGLQDFIGTGIYSGEYIVATKTVGQKLKATAGLGWGRLGSYNPLGSYGERPGNLLGSGGLPTYDRWFRGDIAGFGGLAYQFNDNLTLKLEYSSDAYDDESDRGGFEHNSPLNYGVEYRLPNDARLALYYAYGSTLGFQLSYPMNPKTLGIPGGLEAGGLPVRRRPANSVSDLGWTGALAAYEDNTRQRLITSLQADDLSIEGYQLEPHRATIRLRNEHYGRPAQAIGRAARAMSRIMPDSVEEFVIIPVENGTPMSAITLRRSDLENLENDAAVEMLARASITDAYGKAPPSTIPVTPKFSWSLTSYYETSTFDPDAPFRLDIGAQLGASWQITPNLSLSGAFRKRVIGNIHETERLSPSELPRARTDITYYAQNGDPKLRDLVLAWNGRVGPDLYGRVSAGYLESMYAGVSSEVLWKPVDSALALGVEVNFVRRRDYDQLFALMDNTTYEPFSDVTREIPDFNGHVSAYYDFGGGYTGQMDIGRYLAGDWGTTLTVGREFANGWKFGAFATFTNVSSDEFGEGSFDKGITLTIPMSVGIGTPTREYDTTVIRPITRDGGARLSVPGRLYGNVRTWHEDEITDSWGRFWR
ncbi:YjbH domain-containing protein [Salipiger sp. 1_MG-2023]|uniref:YjbH domain-containing protein n=1 Tax=Salipiger sp. 1_MG-2023 TaxID=3062665 RepID=UPI0026E1B4FD|nr:YjbH domain-containing protein [Salipiger sp. 1_MG-2023]MDO6586423.1 YjbH domain-containing protein [Salipiger sp. 1_MG-2023]